MKTGMEQYAEKMLTDIRKKTRQDVLLPSETYRKICDADMHVLMNMFKDGELKALREFRRVVMKVLYEEGMV